MTPKRHVLLNELAEVAAGKATDHQVYWAVELGKPENNVNLLWAVCRRISFIEHHIRQTQEFPPVAANDIVNSVEFEWAQTTTGVHGHHHASYRQTRSRSGAPDSPSR